MTFIVEQTNGKCTIKYKLEDYYNTSIKLFLQSIASSGLIENCSLVATKNETYYCFSFQASTFCSLRDWLFSSIEPVPSPIEKRDLIKHVRTKYDSSSEEDDEDSDEFMEEGSTTSSITEEASEASYGKMNTMSYKEAILMIHSLSSQLNELRRNRLSFYLVDLDNVFVINGNVFLMMDPEFVLPINSSGLLTFLKPFDDRREFYCPEMAKCNVLPFQCHCNSVYYSFATLVLYCLFEQRLPCPEETALARWRANREELLSKLYGTKLYWFLLRCLEENGTRRQLLYI